MIRIQVSKSTGKIFHVDETDKVTEVEGVSSKDALKTILAKVKAKGLKEK